MPGPSDAVRLCVCCILELESFVQGPKSNYIGRCRFLRVQVPQGKVSTQKPSLPFLMQNPYTSTQYLGTFEPRCKSC